jgi:hypothetical protein
MTEYMYEKEAQIMKEAIKAGLPGKWLGGKMQLDAAGFQYKAEGYDPVIGVTLISGIIRAASLGLEAKDGGFSFYEGASEEGARKLATKVVAWVKSR